MYSWYLSIAFHPSKAKNNRGERKGCAQKCWGSTSTTEISYILTRNHGSLIRYPCQSWNHIYYYWMREWSPHPDGSQANCLPSKSCEFHWNTLGHSLEDCLLLKLRIQHPNWWQCLNIWGYYATPSHRKCSKHNYWDRRWPPEHRKLSWTHEAPLKTLVASEYARQWGPKSKEIPVRLVTIILVKRDTL